MRLDLGKYVIQTDEIQFVVKEKRIVQAGRLTKEENIGKPIEKDLAYCSSLENAYLFLSKRAFIDNDDIKDAISAVNSLRVEIKEIKKLLLAE